MAKVYWAYVVRLESFARRLVRPLEVPDVVQDVFTRAFSESSRLSYDGERDYGPYLLTIARNLIADRARRAGREISVDDAAFLDLPAQEEELEPWADPETMKIVDSYVRGLPAPLRAVHEARYVRGLPQREAAATIGISRQQLRTREAQLREGLAAALRQGEPR